MSSCKDPNCWKCQECGLINNYKRVHCQACFSDTNWNFYELEKYDWDIWGNIFTKMEYFQSIINEIIEIHDIKCNTIKPGFPGTHGVFLLDNDYILKIYAPFKELDDSFYLEFEINSLLYNNNKLLQEYIPKVIAFDTLQKQNLESIWFCSSLLRNGSKTIGV